MSEEKKKLLNKLRELEGRGDPEIAHFLADDALLEFINDEEVTEVFKAIYKWYA